MPKGVMGDDKATRHQIADRRRTARDRRRTKSSRHQIADRRRTGPIRRKDWRLRRIETRLAENKEEER